MVSNRGVKVYPGGLPETVCVDHWRCRFLAADRRSAITYSDIVRLLERLVNAGLEPIKTENLYEFDGEIGYSLGQGE
jgi:isocitrate dehydrogenase